MASRHPSRGSISVPLLRCAGFLLALAGMGFSLSPLNAQSVVLKADNLTPLDQAASWVTALPSELDTALWNGTYTSGTVSIGGGLSIARIQLASPSQAITIASGSGNLTVGSGGIDLSASTQNLTISAPLSLGANQTWSVAAGRVLAINGAVSGGASALTVSGNGAVTLGGNNTYTGNTTVNTGANLTITNSGTVKGNATSRVSTGNTTANLVNSGTIAGTLRIEPGSGPASPNANEFALVTTGFAQLRGGSATGPVSNDGQLTLSDSSQIKAIGPITGTGGLGGINDNNTFAGGKTLVFTAGSSLSYYKPGNGANATLQVEGNGTVSFSYFGYSSTANLTTYVTTFDGGTWNIGKLGRGNTGAQFAGTAHLINGARVNVQTPGFEHGNWYIRNGALTFNGTVAAGQGPTSHNIGLNFTVDRSGGGNGTLTATGLVLALGSANTAAESSSLTVGEGGAVTIGASGLTVGSATNHPAPETNTIHLTGGKILVAGTLQAASTIGANQTRTFLWSGGQLSAGTIVAGAGFNGANSTIGSAGLQQSAGTLAPGDIGTAGRTVITGNYTLGANGTLAVDLGGTTQATAFQTGQYDFVSVSGTASLAGQLAVRVLAGFSPNASQTFTILTGTGGLSGAFSNVAQGARIVSTDGLHTFVVNRSGNSVTLGSYLAVTPPTITSSSAPEVIVEGDHVVLGVTAGSLGPVTYEWRRNGDIIVGAGSSSLTLLDFTSAQGGTYEVTVRNAAGTTTRSFAVRTNVPASSIQRVVDVGTSETFTASPGAASYRWILDGEEVGTSETYVYTPIRREVGRHWLRVVETYSDGTSTTRHWTVGVRIPAPPNTTFLHVSPTGSDSNNGSAGAPFLTLEKARDTIRAMSTQQKAAGVTVYLRGGIHRRTTTFTLSAQDSGTASAPVVYAAFPGETPVLTSTRVLSASQWSPLAASEQFRVATGVNPARIWEVSVAGNARANAFPAVFNEWTMFNALRTSLNGGLFEVFANGERARISRYPNDHPTNDLLTPNLAMNGIATGAAVDGSGYLNGAGNYTLSTGGTVAVGGAFHYSDADASRVARWESALTRGGLWLAGYWRVPWQLNGVRVSVIDQGKKVIGLTTNTSNASAALVSNGIGDKYTRPAGSKKEPWWVLNLLEEMDVPGEWAVDFSRQRLYFLMGRDGSPNDGEVEISDAGGAFFQLNGASDIRLEKLTFQRHLGICVQILNGGSRNLVVGCRFVQAGNMAVDINGGTDNGVLSSDFEKLGSGGVMLRGGSLNGDVPVPANHFAVNNRFRSFSEVVRVYQAAVDVGYGGPMGSWGLPTVGMRVAQNDIRTSPHAGILWNGHRHVIEYNEVSDFTRISNDLGAIYRFGRNADFRTIIRYNHLFDSPLGEGVYNDMDHVRTPVYGNTINLKTPATAGRGYGFWSATHTTTGEANASLPMSLQVYNNISVNAQAGFVFHSATGGRIENNVSFRPRTDHFRWSRITINTGTNTAVVSTSNATTLQSGPNIGYATDPGFIDYSNDDLRLRPDASVYRDMPGFDEVPLELAGNYRDDFRTAETRVWTPFVATAQARAVAGNTAMFTGELVYPQFDQNATVRVYWGTTDGGTDPGAWDHVADLGQVASGTLTYTPSDLIPGTRYFFRFYAVNSAGEHWAENSNSTTTFPLEAVTAAGNASSSSAATSPDLAFDDNTATFWQTAPGVVSASIGYQFTGAPLRVTRYSLTSAPDNPARDPGDWRFEGSMDGSTWVVLDQRQNISFTARGQTLDFGFVNAAAFSFYRLVITANAGDVSSLELAGLKFWSPAVSADTTGPVITTPGNLVVSGNSAGAVVSFEVSAVDAVSGTAVATATPASGSFFPVGNTTVSVTASDAVGNTSAANFTVTVQAPTLPSPWTIQQIKPYSGVAPGTVEVLSAASFRIVGAGGASTGGATADLWTGTNDSNTYVSVPWQGDGTFTARLASFTSTDSSAKAGIIFRETTNSGSRYSAIYLIRNNGGAVLFQHKTATNGASTNTNFFNGSVTNRGIPEWIRMVRAGDTFTLFYSENGTTWTQLSSRTNVMSGASLSVGFVVAPRTGGSSATAVFDNISFLTPRQSWRQTHFASTANSGNASDSADPDGDGFNNLLEYALGSIPTQQGSRPQMEMSTVQIEPDPGTFLELTFQRVADPLLTYAVEAGSDLTPLSWTTIWQSSGAANVAGAVTVTDSFDIDQSSPSQRFLRLRVTAP